MGLWKRNPLQNIKKPYFILYNEEIRNVYTSPDIMVIQWRWIWAGHAACMGEKKFLHAFGTETGKKGTTWKT
jgi:hypothetical protein